MPTDKRVPSLIVNTLTQAQYEALENPSDTEMWLTPYDESILPDQTGQSGKFLTTNGTSASWSEVDTLPSQTGQSGKFLTTDGTNASWATVQGGGGGVAPTVVSFTNKTGTTLATGLTLADYDTILVFKNGILLKVGASDDYTISTNNIVFAVALVSSDIVTIVAMGEVSGGGTQPTAEYAHQGFSIIGSDVQIDNDNIASGFSSYGTNNVNNSHLLVPTLPSSITTMEMYCKFKVTGDMTLANTPYPLFLPDTTTLGQALYVQAATSQSARVLSLWDGSSNYTGTTVIDANTDYEMKATYVNGYFTTYIKVNGSWVQQFQCSSNIFSGYAVGIGGSYGSDRLFAGDIYLDDTSIYINGSRWFTGAKVPAVIDMRSAVGYDSSKTQVLENIQGTLTWVDAA